jgi:hypothetical protein
MNIKKRNGKIEVYQADKLQNSIEKVGLTEVEAELIVKEIEAKRFKKILTTRKLHQETFWLLRKRSNAAAARYNIKKSVQELGPSGYPFERFFGELMKALNYKVEVGVHLQGNCLTHEIDVLADKVDDENDVRIMTECKFKNRLTHKVDTQTVLYIQARFQDLSKFWQKDSSLPKTHKVCVATNTGFTTDAIKYSECMQMLLVSWDYPRKGQNLKRLIDDTATYPLTCLTTLTKAEKQVLLNKKVVLVRDIQANKLILDALNLTSRQRNKVLKEVGDLCRI